MHGWNDQGLGNWKICFPAARGFIKYQYFMTTILGFEGLFQDMSGAFDKHLKDVANQIMLKQLREALT